MANTIPQMYIEITQKQPKANAQLSKDAQGKFQPTDYGTLLQEVGICASGLHKFGIKRGENIGLISDNRKEWVIADLAMQGLGAADVPRGCDSTPRKLLPFRLERMRVVIFENDRQLQKILDIKAGRIPFTSQSLREGTMHPEDRHPFDPPPQSAAEEARNAA